MPMVQTLGTYEWNWTGTDPITGLSLSDDGDILVAISHTTLYVFATAIPEPLWTYVLGGEITSVALSADGNRIVLGCDSKMFVFNPENSIPLFEWHTNVVNLYEVDISKDGDYIISIDNASTLNFFNLSQPLFSIPQWNISLTSGGIKDIAISGDGSRIIVGSPDMNLTCFNSISNVPYWSVENFSSSVDITFDGSFIASSAYNNPYIYRFAGNGDLNASYTLTNLGLQIKIAVDGNKWKFRDSCRWCG